ncbi:MAG: Streptothricin hydrolase [Pseudomonas citronellolis]|nr:MAG: Streptothricin hydrolase [Pseudomonas citronellolis]
MARQALLLIDIQNDYFPTGKWPLSGIDAAAAVGTRVLAAFRERGAPVVHVRHEFDSADAPFFAPGSDGAAIHDSVAALPGEPVILKHAVNAFQNTDLHATLQGLDVDSLVVIGHMSHMCVDGAVRAAADLGYTVTVLHDACATLDLEFNGARVPAAQVQAAYMSALAFAYAEVTDSASFLVR